MGYSYITHQAGVEAALYQQVFGEGPICFAGTSVVDGDACRVALELNSSLFDGEGGCTLYPGGGVFKSYFIEEWRASQFRSNMGKFCLFEGPYLY